MRSTLVPILLVVMLAAGCASNAASLRDPVKPGAASRASASDGAPTPDANGSARLRTLVAEGDTKAVATVGTGGGGHVGDPANVSFAIPNASIVNATITAAWTRGTPLQETLIVSACTSGGGADSCFAKVKGSSPLTLSISAAGLGSIGTLFVHAIPDQGGASTAASPVHVVLTLVIQDRSPTA